MQPRLGSGGHSSAGRLPTFLIVGAMKCGTTALARYLSAHPEVFVSPRKEPHYFDRNLDKGHAWYRTHFAGAGSESQVGEASAYYLCHPQAPPAMADLLPDAKLIALVRNPVDRAYSHYWHSCSRGRESLSFEDAVACEPDRLAHGGSARYYGYVALGRYLGQLERLCSHYRRGQVLVILSEDMRQQPVATFQHVCRFLEVDDVVPDVVGTPMNVHSKFRSLRLQHLSRRLPTGLATTIRKVNTRTVGYAPMSATTRTRLLEHFAPHNAALGTWLRRDLSVWDS